MSEKLPQRIFGLVLRYSYSCFSVCSRSMHEFESQKSGEECGTRPPCRKKVGDAVPPRLPRPLHERNWLHVFIFADVLVAYSKWEWTFCFALAPKNAKQLKDFLLFPGVIAVVWQSPAYVVRNLMIAICYSDFLQVNTCLINGNCYDDGEVNPENSFEFCNASSNSTEWTVISLPESTTVEITSTVILTTTAPGDFNFWLFCKYSVTIIMI